MILVTGATGHIGNVLVRKLLDAGKKYVLIWRDEDTTRLKTWILRGCSAMCSTRPHSSPPCAAWTRSITWLHYSIMPGKNPFVWRVNVEGTRNVLEAARHARIPPADLYQLHPCHCTCSTRVTWMNRSGSTRTTLWRI